MGHLQRVWHADRGCLLLRTPGPVPLGLAYALLIETNPFPNLSLFFRTMLFEYPSVLSRFCFTLFYSNTNIKSNWQFSIRKIWSILFSFFNRSFKLNSSYQNILNPKRKLHISLMNYFIKYDETTVLHLIVVHDAFESQQRTLTPPDTWSCPTLGLACVLISRSISPEHVLFLDVWVSNIPRYYYFALRINGNFWTLVNEANLRQVDLNALHDLHDTLAPWYYEGEITNLVGEREYSKTMKNHQMLITERSNEVSYLT